MRLAADGQLLQSGGVTRLIAKGCSSVMIGMAPLPIWKDYRFGARRPYFFGQSEAVLDRRGQPRIAEIQPFPKPGSSHNTGGFGFLGPEFCCTASSHFALGEIYNAH